MAGDVARDPAGSPRPGEIQVVVPPSVQEPMRAWLASRGLCLFPIPVETDLPTFGVAWRDAETAAEPAGPPAYPDRGTL